MIAIIVLFVCIIRIKETLEAQMRLLHNRLLKSNTHHTNKVGIYFLYDIYKMNLNSQYKAHLINIIRKVSTLYSQEIWYIFINSICLVLCVYCGKYTESMSLSIDAKLFRSMPRYLMNSQACCQF